MTQQKRAFYELVKNTLPPNAKTYIIFNIGFRSKDSSWLILETWEQWEESNAVRSRNV
jgi:hypothetical protein